MSAVTPSILLALLLVVDLFTSPPPAHANDNQPVIKVSSEAWETYTIDGQGYLFELISAIYKPLGYQIEFSFCPWKRCITNIIQSKSDIIAGIYDNEVFIGKGIEVNHHPVLIERVGVAYQQSPSTAWQGQQSLKDQSVASLRGFNYHHELDVAVKLVEVSNNHQEWQLLSSQRVKYVLSDLYTLQTYQLKYQSATRKFKIQKVFDKPAYYGFTRSAKGDELRRIFDTYYPILYATGQVQALQQKWNIPPTTPP